MFKQNGRWAVVGLLVCGCGRAAGQAAPPLTFTDVTSTSQFNANSSWILLAMSQAWNDFNGDGILDCMIGGITGNMLLGSAQNRFSRTQQLQLAVYQLCSADIDNDGDIDVYSAYRGLGENDGTGRMTDRRFPGLALTYSLGIAAPDFDQDGWADVVAAYGNTSAVLGRNLGSRSTITPIEFVEVGPEQGFALPGVRWLYGTIQDADLNDDGVPDLIHADSYEGVQVLMSGEDGYALRTLARGSGSAYYAFSSATTGDVDNDGDLDIFNGADHQGIGNGMLINTGDGVFGANGSMIPDAQASQWNGAAFGDLDNDGDLDVVLRSFYRSTVEVRLNDGRGNFTRPGLTLASMSYPCDARLIDYDNDGDLDIAVVGYFDQRLYSNQTNNDRYLKVRVIGLGEGGTNVSGVGVRVDVMSAATGALLARRDVTSANGNGSGPFWLHFGGLTPTSEYIVRAHFASRTVEQRVTPTFTSSLFGARSIRQMATIVEPPLMRRVVTWQETGQDGVVAAALRAEMRRRGLIAELLELRQAGQENDVDRLLGALGARSPKEALGENADLLQSGQRRGWANGNWVVD